MTRYSNCTVLSGLKLTNIIRVDNFQSVMRSLWNPVLLFRGRKDCLQKWKVISLEEQYIWFGFVWIGQICYSSWVVCQPSRWDLSLWLVILHQTCLGSDRHMSYFGDQKIIWHDEIHKKTVSCTGSNYRTNATLDVKTYCGNDKCRLYMSFALYEGSFDDAHKTTQIVRRQCEKYQLTG